jgi:hypothetical protein
MAMPPNPSIRPRSPPFELEAIGRHLAFFTDPWGNLIELAQVLR